MEKDSIAAQSGNKILKLNNLNFINNSFILIVSKRNSGKTVLTKNLIYVLYQKYNYDSIILFSETAHFNTDYNFLPKNCVFKFNKIEQQIKKILDYSANKRKLKKKFHILIILDDVILNNKSIYLNLISWLGRHHFITCICSVQYCKGLISSVIRNNLDYIFFSDVGYVQIEALYECIWTNLNKKEFIKYIYDNNNNYNFLMYDSKEKERKDRLKIVHADILELKFY